MSCKISGFTSYTITEKHFLLVCIFLALNYLPQRATQDYVKKKKFLSYFAEVHLPLRKHSDIEAVPPIQPPSSVSLFIFTRCICGGLSMYQTLSTVLGPNKSPASFLTLLRHPPSGGLAITQYEKCCNGDIDSVLYEYRDEAMHSASQVNEKEDWREEKERLQAGRDIWAVWI